jgi:hypothetical protein
MDDFARSSQAGFPRGVVVTSGLIGPRSPACSSYPLDQSDGVVRYASAHLEGMASEKNVISAHSGAQDHPESIAEVRRILLEQLASP